MKDNPGHANVQVNGKPPAPAEPGNERSVTHGAFSERKIEPRAKELAAEVLLLAPGGVEGDEYVAQLLGRVLSRLELAESWIDQDGLFVAGKKPQPILTHINRWTDQASSLLNQLGLSPRARAALGFDPSNPPGESIVKRMQRGNGGES